MASLIPPDVEGPEENRTRAQDRAQDRTQNRQPPRPPKTAFSAGFTARASVSPQRRLSSRQYVRIVDFLRWLLPAGALILMAGLITWPDFGGNGAEDSRAQAPGANDESLRLTNPRYVGMDSHNRPFVITAALAIQDKLNPGRVRLEGLQADITLEDGTWLNIEAATGRYERATKFLYVEDQVLVFSDIGYQLTAWDLVLDLENGTVASDRPIAGQGPRASFKADGFRISDNGRRVMFTGVTVTYRPAGGKGKDNREGG